MCDYSKRFCSQIGMNHKFDDYLKVNDCIALTTQKILSYALLGENLSKTLMSNFMTLANLDGDAKQTATATANLIVLSVVCPVCAVAGVYYILISWFKKIKPKCKIEGNPFPDLYVGCIKNKNADRTSSQVLPEDHGCRYINECHDIAQSKNHDYFGFTNPDSCGSGGEQAKCFTGENLFALRFSEDLTEGNNCDCTMNGHMPGLGNRDNMSLYVRHQDLLGQY